MHRVVNWTKEALKYIFILQAFYYFLGVKTASHAFANEFAHISNPCMAWASSVWLWLIMPESLLRMASGLGKIDGNSSQLHLKLIFTPARDSCLTSAWRSQAETQL